MAKNFTSSELNGKFGELAGLCRQNGRIDPELYSKYDVKRGLRDINGKGVLGLTYDFTPLEDFSRLCDVSGNGVRVERISIDGIDVVVVYLASCKCSSCEDERLESDKLVDVIEVELVSPVHDCTVDSLDVHTLICLLDASILPK